MMKALLSVRFRALMAAMTNQARKKGKPQSEGMLILFAVLYIYVGVVICGAVCLVFSQLAVPYHTLGIDWLYFSMAGLMGLAFAVMGSVFTTQNQLYDARDNDMLLAMPIPPQKILMSRMIPLLLMNLLFAGIVMIPAAVMYAILIRFSIGYVICQLLCLAAVVLLAQAVSCLLGWGLHLLLSKMNRSAASLLYMVVFLVVYFAVYSQASSILNAMTANGMGIASSMRLWGFPLYAMGMGAMGNILYLLLFLLMGAALFGIVYYLLSATFMKTATMRRSAKRRKLDLKSVRSGSAAQALGTKELRRFLGSPVYLTNMGVGIFLVAALAVAGLIFRNQLMEALGPMLPMFSPYIGLIICAILCYCASTICISTPSVSLEGKNIWVLKSMPVSTKQILSAKLHFHCMMGVPVTSVAGLILAIAYGCSLADTLLCALVPGLMVVLSGLLGLICGLQWARLDWINEAYPCKQSAAVMVTMFSMMGFPVLLGLLYYALLSAFLSPSVFLVLTAAITVLLCAGLYHLLVTWGVRKWDSL